ncbi:hypothetical protein Plec18170_009710 [Paecilomyces lecythidis]
MSSGKLTSPNNELAKNDAHAVNFRPQSARQTPPRFCFIQQTSYKANANDPTIDLLRMHETQTFYAYMALTDQNQYLHNCLLESNRQRNSLLSAMREQELCVQKQAKDIRHLQARVTALKAEKSRSLSDHDEEVASIPAIVDGSSFPQRKV